MIKYSKNLDMIISLLWKGKYAILYERALYDNNENFISFPKSMGEVPVDSLLVNYLLVFWRKNSFPQLWLFEKCSNYMQIFSNMGNTNQRNHNPYSTLN